MKLLSLIIIVTQLLIITGCAGTGFNKKATLIPDELSVATDVNPEKNWECSEVTVEAKWKLK